jgi:hypothetical protein
MVEVYKLTEVHQMIDGDEDLTNKMNVYLGEETFTCRCDGVDEPDVDRCYRCDKVVPPRPV